LREPAELCERLGLDADAASPAAAAAFGLRVTPQLLGRIRRGDAADPVLRQVLPTAAELEPRQGYVADPVGDLAAVVVPGLLQKYAGRALLVVTGACAVHCRYCFRRHYPYAGHAAGRHTWQAAVAQLARDTDVREVILSGGDPLMLPDDALGELWEALAAIPHLRRLRIHTRMPVVLPERVTPALVELLDAPRFAASLVTHVNHPAELDAVATAALATLRCAGVRLLNQSVLLRGVNDDADTLCALSETLFDAGVLPYYLHLLDPVAGAAHFAVEAGEALRLIELLRARLPGYLVPRLAREIPGTLAKTVLAG
jgi:EF-P beta-lysylation protein EpmB